jgi:hypothetical protein
MSTLEGMQKEQSTVNLFFATVLLIPFQLLVLFSMENAYLTSDTMLLWQLLGYFVMTIIYCIVTSLLFHPKRIISPINIQVGTATTFSIFKIYNTVQTTQFMSTIGNLAGSLLFLTIFLIIIGWVQLPIVKWVIGLNFDSIDRTSFQIDGNLRDIMRILGDEFCNVWKFSRRRDNPKAKKPIWVMKRFSLNRDFVVLAIGQSNNKNKCILATVAFHADQYGISKTKNASEIRNSIINDIEVRLMSSNLELNPTPLDKTDDAISTIAYEHAIAGTHSKIEITKGFFRNIPRFYRYAICITFIAFVGITIVFGMKLLDLSAYIGVAVVLVIALIIELGVPLREELSRQIEELD